MESVKPKTLDLCACNMYIIEKLPIVNLHEGYFFFFF